jgi:hypothetical protein
MGPASAEQRTRRCGARYWARILAIRWHHQEDAASPPWTRDGLARGLNAIA